MGGEKGLKTERIPVVENSLVLRETKRPHGLDPKTRMVMRSKIRPRVDVGFLSLYCEYH